MAENSNALVTPHAISGDWSRLQRLPSDTMMAPYSQTHDGSIQHYNSAQATPYGSPAPARYSSNQESTHRGSTSRHDWQTSVGNYYPVQTAEGHYMLRPSASESTYKGNTKRQGTRTVASSRQTTSSPPPNKIVRRAKQKKPSPVVNLEEPLSKLTKDSTIPIKDMHAFVHRSVEERMREKERKNGYIVRPMNAFMLYRSAYADRAKNLCEQNNHQVVSKATGQSWRLETKEVQDYYKQLSETERENHQKAWPDYKFSPSKSIPAARKRKGASSETEDDGFEQEISDYDWTPAGSRKPRPTRNTNRGTGEALELTAPHGISMPYATMPAGNAPYFSLSSPVRTVSMPMQFLDHSGPDAPYHTPEQHGQTQNYVFMEDIRFQQAPYHAPYFGDARHGVPGGGFNEFYEFEAPQMLHQPQVILDPTLVLESQPSVGPFNEHNFTEFNSDTLGPNSMRKLEGPLQVIGEDIGVLDGDYSGAGTDALKQWIDETNNRDLEG